jgi:hypothetical protein
VVVAVRVVAEPADALDDERRRLDAVDQLVGDHHRLVAAPVPLDEHDPAAAVDDGGVEADRVVVATADPDAAADDRRGRSRDEVGEQLDGGRTRVSCRRVLRPAAREQRHEGGRR